MRNVCKKVSSRPTDLFCRFSWKDFAGNFFPATTTQLSSQSLSPTLFAAVLNFFLPLTISAISGAIISSNLAPMRFASGTIYLRKNGIAVLPITCASAPNPRPRCRPVPL